MRYYEVVLNKERKLPALLRKIVDKKQVLCRTDVYKIVRIDFEDAIFDDVVKILYAAMQEKAVITYGYRQTKG